MATKPSTKRPAPAKAKTTKAAATRAAARKPRPPAAKPPAPKRERGPRLGGHGYDVGGLVLVLLALVTALSVYADLAGPAGRAIGDGAGVVLGYGRWALPFLLAGVSRQSSMAPAEPVRLGVGLSLASFAGCGLIHLIAGGPGWGAGAADLRSSGGIVGTITAVPLRAVLAGPGAAAVLVTVLGVASLVLARTTVRTAASQAGGMARRGGRGLASLGRSLTELRPPARQPRSAWPAWWRNRSPTAATRRTGRSPSSSPGRSPSPAT